jgi:hypothetical protein
MFGNIFSTVKKFEFLIEYQCPQCGAPAILTETDRLFTCQFCRVKSYLLPGDYFRYVLAYIVGRRSAEYRKLRDITIEPGRHLLVYVPFVKTGLEFHHPSLNVSFLKSQL